MATKLGKSAFPSSHGPNDFKCFGPPAMEDGNFENCKIADMGSFSQDDKDSNKYYHAAIIQSRLNNQWFVYFEWGRVGAKAPQFQFVQCRDEAEAQREFAAQCHEKNDKRGVWSQVAGVRTLTAKPGKDVYLVRQLATRSTGLPDAKTIKYTDGAKKKDNTKPSANKNQKSADRYTSKLLTDLIGGTISYTRGSMADDSIPTQGAIDMGRSILTEAQKRLVAVGQDIDDQIGDRELRQLSGELYRRIPKKKPVGTPDRVWILSADNILMWKNDLDAFESALSSQSDDNQPGVDPYHGLPLTMEWIEPNSDLGKFLYFWWPKASNARHQMKIKNIWKVDRTGDEARVRTAQDEVATELQKGKLTERPLYQPSERFDVTDKAERELFGLTNTCLMFHGTRSVNVKGILEKSLILPAQLVGVTVNGAMFGPGLYFADDWRKSANYTSGPWAAWATGGSVTGRDAFMFACDVVVGKAYTAPEGKGFIAPPDKHHSVYGKAGFSKRHRDYGGGTLINNEWIVYKSNQQRLRYLAEFTVTG